MLDYMYQTDASVPTAQPKAELEGRTAQGYDRRCGEIGSQYSGYVVQAE